MEEAGEQEGVRDGELFVVERAGEIAGEGVVAEDGWSGVEARDAPEERGEDEGDGEEGAGDAAARGEAGEQPGGGGGRGGADGEEEEPEEAAGEVAVFHAQGV